MGAQSGKRGDDLVHGNILYIQIRVFYDLFHSCGSCVRALPVVGIRSGRSDQQVPMDGRSDKDTFSQLPGQSEDRVSYMGAG